MHGFFEKPIVNIKNKDELKRQWSSILEENEIVLSKKQRESRKVREINFLFYKNVVL